MRLTTAIAHTSVAKAEDFCKKTVCSNDIGDSKFSANFCKTLG
jgi:hypothetical protein